MCVLSLGWEDPLKEGMATHSSILAWRIPWTQEPGGQFFASMWEIRWQKGFPDGTEFRVGGLCLQRTRVRRRARTHGTSELSLLLVMCVPAKPAHLITGQEGRFQVFSMGLHGSKATK